MAGVRISGNRLHRQSLKNPDGDKVIRDLQTDTPTAPAIRRWPTLRRIACNRARVKHARAEKALLLFPADSATRTTMPIVRLEVGADAAAVGGQEVGTGTSAARAEATAGAGVATGTAVPWIRQRIDAHAVAFLAVIRAATHFTRIWTNLAAVDCAVVGIAAMANWCANASTTDSGSRRAGARPSRTVLSATTIGINAALSAYAVALMQAAYTAADSAQAGTGLATRAVRVGAAAIARHAAATAVTLPVRAGTDAARARTELAAGALSTAAALIRCRAIIAAATPRLRRARTPPTLAGMVPGAVLVPAAVLARSPTVMLPTGAAAAALAADATSRAIRVKTT